MTADPARVVPLGTYRSGKPYPFCPGCGHGGILDALNAALVSLQLDPRGVVIVSDIGCSGLSDQYFRTNAFHGLHGRSVAYATGIKLARPDLTVIVVMGDGGCGIGGTHLLAAARRNVGLTVLVFNNFNFGMTGGQASVTTPEGAVTSTSPLGHLEQPLDVCATVAVNGAGYVYRGTVFDKDLPDRVAEGIASGGFALLDVWELCTAYFVPQNTFSRKALYDTLETLGLRTGVLSRQARAEYTRAYAETVAARATPAERQPLRPRFLSPLDRRMSLLLAGSAGGKVRTAARLAAQAAVLSSLFAAQRDDYPVTVKTGYSLSELILSPEPIDDVGVALPEVVVISSEEGRAQASRRLRALGPESRVYTLPGLAGVETGARTLVLDPSRRGLHLPSASAAIALLAAALVDLDVVPAEALLAAAEADEGARHAEDNARALALGVDLSGLVRT